MDVCEMAHMTMFVTQHNAKRVVRFRDGVNGTVSKMAHMTMFVKENTTPPNQPQSFLFDQFAFSERKCQFPFKPRSND